MRTAAEELAVSSLSAVDPARPATDPITTWQQVGDAFPLIALRQLP
jgi:hypothetical protein